MAEILEHGQQLDLRARRGADFSLLLSLLDAPGGSPINLAGATAVSRIFAAGQPDVVFTAVVNGAGGTISVSVPAGTTRNMQQEWQYVLGYKTSLGVTTALLFGAFRVAQEAL